MGQVLHGSARTTEAVRRAVQRSEESVRALAKRHGISPTTVQKWRKRSFVADLPMGPIEVRSNVLSVEEEAMISRSGGIRCCRSMIASMRCNRRSPTSPGHPFIAAFSATASAGCPR